MKKVATYIVIVIIVAALFFFLPVLAYSHPDYVSINTCGGDCAVTVKANDSAQVSPSYYFFKCGIVENPVLIYTYYGTRQVGESSGGGWFCGTRYFP